MIVINPYVFAAGGGGGDSPPEPGPVPTYVGKGAFSGSTVGAFPAYPASYAVDDVWLMIVETANEAVTGVSGPSGWTLVATPIGVGTPGDASAVRLSVFWRRVTSLSETGTSTGDPGNHAAAQILGFRGCRTTGEPFEVLGADTLASASSTITIPGGSTLGANRLVVAMAAGHVDNLAGGQVSGEANGSLASLAERADDWAAAGNGGGVVAYTGEKAAAGSVSATTATASAACIQERLCIALIPPNL